MNTRVVDPANVPMPTDVRWEIVRREPATQRQIEHLLDLAEWEGIDLADLFGDGYDLDTLSKWSAHWGIEVLESRAKARAVEEAARAVEERREQAMKSWIADYFRSKNPGKYPYTNARMEF